MQQVAPFLDWLRAMTVDPLQGIATLNIVDLADSTMSQWKDIRTSLAPLPPPPPLHSLTVLGWDLYMIAHLLRLPHRRQEKVTATLDAIPRRKLLGLLLSITQAVAGLRGMFTWTTGRHVQLTSDVHDELGAWRKLVRSLESQITYFRKLQPFHPTCIGTTNAFGSGMGGV